jgi:hypothetical protein
MALRSSRASVIYGSIAGMALQSAAGAVEHVVPFYQYKQTLVAATEMDGGKYLAFPITVRLSEDEILVGYKRGFAHAFGREADFDLLRLNPVSERVRRQTPSLHRAGLNLQNGEFVRFANGDIACFVDVQKPGRERDSDEATRLGLIEFRSRDNGNTFEDRGRVGAIDGVEYGYAFDAITEGATTWMLVMTFANLPGGRSVVPSRPKAGDVAVLRTDDNGNSWRRVKNLTETFQSPLNESAFMRYEDGFIFVCRPYADAQPLIVTDGDFNVRRRVNLVQKYDFIGKGMGRPRVFMREGRYYILARNTFKDDSTAPGRRAAIPDQVVNRVKLGLFRFDPETLVIDRHVILDNAENQRVASAYYATPYWVTKKGRSYFNVVTYKQITGRMPDIVRFEYEWDEVK